MPVRIGFAGTGGIAGAHLINLVRIPEAEVVALYDVDRERCEVAMRRINGQQDQAARPGGPEPRKLQAKVYTDFKAMLTEAGLHAVYICVPPFAHGDLELAAIDAGLALFVEKPVALSLDLARQVAHGIEAKSLVSASGYQTRYSEATDRAKELIGNKTIGMALGFYLGGLPGTPWWRVQAQSGGQLVEQATHTVDLMRYLVGDVTKVYAAGALRLLKDTPSYDIFDVATTTLHFASGAIGTVANTSALNGGSATGAPSGVHLILQDMRLEIWGTTLKVTVGGKTEEHRFSAQPMLAEDQAFVEAVARKDPNRVRSSYLDAARTLAVTLAAEESARTGLPVDVPKL
ncbi:MAG TPA: Gfo/Idh/MocA family oxidoreductase [Chloroflexota bacterium]|nr:Gfo/Idh/MocA family oxidoreductase [Chloroflexota bacterium]